MKAGERAQPPLLWPRPDGDVRIAVFICYEAILPQFVLELASERPDLLASLSNDSWFGDTWEPHQHLAFSRFRCVEHRAPMVRAANTGISAVVDATGEVVERVGVGREGALVRDVPLVPRERTPWQRFGHLVPWALFVAAGACLLASWASARRARG
jgi:apolipoprotein N-acyltransferase